MIEGKYYPHNGKQYIRVTHIIARLEKLGLHPWIAKVTREGDNWREIGEQEAEWGSMVHHIIYSPDEHDLLDLEEPVDNAYKGYLKYCDEMNPENIKKEFTVYSDEYMFAGTGDSLDKMNGSPILIDYKASSRLYPEQHVIQGAAYLQAYNETFDADIRRFANVRLSKDKIAYQWREYLPEELKIGWKRFKHLLADYKLEEQWKKLQKKKK